MNMLSKYMFAHEQIIIVITPDTYQSYSLVSNAFDDMNDLPMSIHNGTVGNISTLLGIDIRPIITRRLIRSFMLSNMTKIYFRPPRRLAAMSANLVVLHNLSHDETIYVQQWLAPFASFTDIYTP